MVHLKNSAEAFALVKSNGARARCAVWSHMFGWELVLEINGSLYASQVCRNSEQILTTQEQWKKAMLDKGWQ